MKARVHVCRALVTVAIVGNVIAPSGAVAQTKVATVGFLGASTSATATDRVAAFSRRLNELGWIEGRTVAIEYRWADGRSDRYATLAAELVQRKVDVIVTWGTATVIAAKRATAEIPIVFAVSADPVGTGLVATLSRPGANVTGLSTQHVDMAGKRLEILREVVPALRRPAVMSNAGNPASAREMREIQEPARALGVETIPVEIRRAEDIGPAIERLRGRADALFVVPDALMNTNRDRVNALAMGARLPTMQGFREAGGLLSYGPDYLDLFRRSAEYVDRILRGAKPGDLPVEQRPSSSWWSTSRSRESSG